ncbi:MAG: hypothetical protein U5J78_02895 [Parasphingorhabdus sp.]|nr:hypothetical protein [Parasphingorhabdus sp.]
MHQLRDHPLLTLDALVALATTMNAADVEYNPGNLPIGIAPDAVPVASLGIAETIRSIAENGSWMVLKRIEQNPAYRAMLDELLDQVETLTSTATGPMLGREGFILGLVTQIGDAVSF